MIIYKSALIVLAVAFALTAVGVTGAYAVKSVPTEVTLGKSAILTLPNPVARVSLADPEVADVIVITPTEIQLNGLKVGSTTLIVWDKAGGKTFFDLQVHIDLEALKEEIGAVAPGDDIHYKLINPSTLVVSGSVSTEERKIKIQNMLRGFGKDITDKDLYILQGGVVREVRSGTEAGDTGFKFVLLLEVDAPYQVLLQITVASIDRSASRELGFNWSYVTNEVTIDSAVSSLTSGITSVSGLIEGSSGGGLSTDVTGATFSVVDWHNGAQYFLKALAGKGLAKILAEPNLLVKSGSSGSFLAGGEFPVPVAQGSIGGGLSNAITIVYKEFGVRMHFTPLVRENGLIKLGMGQPHSVDLNSGQQITGIEGIEVSSLDYANAITLEGFRIPAIKKDSVSTSVDLRDGETFIIAGLINEEWSKSLDKMPLLGDIPILGAFFRDQRLSKSERELVFLVTPKIMKPMKPGERVELPGSAEPTERQTDDLRWIPLLPSSHSMDPEQLR